MTDLRKLMRAYAAVGMSLCIALPSHAEYKKAMVGELYYVFDTAARTATVSNGKPGLIKAGVYSAFAEENRTYAAGNITIPQEVTHAEIKYRVIAIDEGAFYNSPIGGISIPASVTKIGRSAFSNSALRSVAIACPNVTLGDYVFSQCANLSFVKLPEGLKDIPKATFSQSGIPYITIPESVTSIGEEAFFKCQNIENITFPAHLTVLPQMVCCHCSALRSVSLPEGLTTIGDAAFNSCTQLSTINFPNSLTEIGNWAFKDCRRLTGVTLPGNVKTGTEAFVGSGLQKSSAGKQNKSKKATSTPAKKQATKKRTSIYD